MRRLRGAQRLKALATLAFGSAAAAACGSHGSGAAPSDAGADATLAAVTLPDAAFFPDAPIPYDPDGAIGDAGPPRVPVAAELVSSRTIVQQVMFAAGEMQTSGEPFAEFFAGRNLNDYDRTYLPPDEYLLNDNTALPVTPIKDLFGFSTAVESYEYSKMHMNMIANQTTAGLSLANGPVLTATQQGATSLARLVARASELLTAAGSDVAGYAQLPAPTGNTTNYLGFTGLWPNFAPFSDFDPTMDASAEVVKSCTTAGGYGGIPTLGQELPEFECAYNTLHLPNRDAQVNKVLVPAALGFATWKESLWSIDFAGRLHDSQSNPVTLVPAGQGPLIGTPNNQVQCLDPGAAVGTYLGSTPLENMWGLFMLDEMDNLGELLWSQLTTADGATLGGFASREDATAYDYTSPLRWFPAAIGVTEDETVVPYPGIAGFTLNDPTSRSVDLAALLLGNAQLFGETDARNPGVGQQTGLMLTFNAVGGPGNLNLFPTDDGVADGENTLHDRTLALLRVAFVDIDRMHTVPLASGGAVTVDTATVSGGVATPGSTVTTTNLGHVIIGLHKTLLSLNAAITEYGSANPSPAADALGILNPIAIHPPATAGDDGGPPPLFSPRVRQVLTANANFVRDVLTTSTGTVANSATIDAQGNVTLDTSPTTLDNQAAAVRALIEAFLATSDPTYQARATAVMTQLLTGFYSAPARMYRWTAAGADDIVMTPEVFAWLQSALRETYKSLYVVGDPNLGRDVLADRVARVNKLYLNGWDDLNGNQTVDHGGDDGGLPNECLTARMQLGEQALTGELGRNDFGEITTDRDQDCVLEIDGAGTGSLLAAQVHFHSP
jgi:hypothetical protein